MESFLALLDRYPGAWTVLGPVLAYVLWGIVSGIFNSLYDRYSPHSDPEWAAAFAAHPRWGAIVSLFKTAGWNIPGALRSLRVLFGGALPTPIGGAFQGQRPNVFAIREAVKDVVRAELLEENAKAIDNLAAPIILTPAVPPPLPEETPKP